MDIRLLNDYEDEKKDTSQPFTLQNDSADLDIDDESDKFHHNQSDAADDDDHYNENTLPAKSLKVIKEIISRHYALLFVCTVFGASLGFIIYLFCSYNIWVYILGFIGFIIGIILDAKVFDSQKRTKLMVDYEPTKEEKEVNVVCVYYYLFDMTCVYIFSLFFF